jgi:enamine deaminase RidA (YjgF/YER057c/UK114 family)
VTKPRFLNPETIAPPHGYSHVVETSGPGRTVYISGQLGLQRDGALAGGPGDFRAQAIQAFENLREALQAVEAGFQDVVKVDSFLLDIKHLPILREVRRGYFNMAAPPASTTVAVPALAREGALFEIDAIAVLPAGRTGEAG